MKEDQQINRNHIKHLKAVIASYGHFFVVWLVIMSCGSKKEHLNQKPYDGPIMRIDSVNTLITDSAKILLRIQAPIEEVFENNDREWKEGLFLQYYDEFGKISSTFKSNYAFYDKKKHLYKGVGDVIVQNATTGDELNTEELFWNPKKKEFYTNKFVTIRTEDEIHKGTGMTASEDFSSYKILNPSGTFTPDKNTTPQ